MRYIRGDIAISVEQINGFGKNPSLWICEGNQYTKVASFGSEEKAAQFCKWLEYILGITQEEVKYQ